jgi:uncharacterized protein YdeI (YjbR/CyaY-like superfamily)
MNKINSRIDDYIASSANFAQPILTHLRKLVHTACPDVEETIKWGFPHFDYKGVFVSMAAFKEHCAFNFWKAKLMQDRRRIFSGQDEKSMGHLGKIRSLKDLPSDSILLEYLKEAVALNDEGKKVPPRKVADKDQKDLVVPRDLLVSLSSNDKARATFDQFPYSKKREYIDWINEAKTDVTRQKRRETAVEWMAEGKSRNWKYK